MATAAPHSIFKRGNRSLFCTSSLLLVFLFCVFLSRNILHPPNLNAYSDFVSRRGPDDIVEKSNHSQNPASLDLDGVEGKGVISSSKIESNEEAAVPVSSSSDLDVEYDQKSETIPKTSEPTSSFEEFVLHNSSKPAIGEKTEGVQDIFDSKESVEKGDSSGVQNVAPVDTVILEKLRNCNFYRGKWVEDENYPLYAPGKCPYVDEGFDCQSNGRPDSGYLKWRWKPDECDLPRFNATDFLVRLSGRRLLLVGDSMNRNQFESLLCLLREGLPDKSRMVEIHGYKITKGRGYYVFKFEDFNCTVEFIRSHFLVREGIRVNAQGNSNPTLSIDKIDKSAKRWMKADILVFNTGHWWTHGKTSRGKNYYKEGNYVYPQFDAVEAYRRAIRTWAKWIKDNISSDKLVFYRGYSSAHFRGGDWDSGGTCNGEEKPVVQGAILKSYPEKMTILEQVLKDTGAPVVLLNITTLTNYRKDGHPSIYGKNVTRQKKVSTRRQDCSHWCLPGVPDVWNELIYATLVLKQT